METVYFRWFFSPLEFLTLRTFLVIPVRIEVYHCVTFQLNMYRSSTSVTFHPLSPSLPFLICVFSCKHDRILYKFSYRPLSVGRLTTRRHDIECYRPLGRRWGFLDYELVALCVSRDGWLPCLISPTEFLSYEGPTRI